MLQGKNIVLGVSGGIAVYKAVEIVSRLKKLGANVDVIMTKNSLNFVAPLSFETLSNNAVVTDTFKRAKSFEVEHISLSKKADLLVVAPATANVIAKFALGIADDMLSTTFLACEAKKLIAPAMNSAMYRNQTFKKNLDSLVENGAEIIEANFGFLACGDTGEGRMAEPIEIVDKIIAILNPVQDLLDKTFIVTAGGTQEPIDLVRFITNRSSGKMGLAIANEINNRGGKVILIVGKVSVEIPKNLHKVIKVATTIEMMQAVKDNLDEANFVIKSAAPSDYRVENFKSNKIKGDNITLNLVKNPDIAKEIGKIKGNKKLIIFCAETDNLKEWANKKLADKNADMVVANDVSLPNAGFEIDTNIATIITKTGEITDCPLMTKKELAKIIVNKAILL